MSIAFGFGKSFANGWQVVFFPTLTATLVPLQATFLPFAAAAGARTVRHDRDESREDEKPAPRGEPHRGPG